MLYKHPVSENTEEKGLWEFGFFSKPQENYPLSNNGFEQLLAICHAYFFINKSGLVSGAFMRVTFFWFLGDTKKIKIYWETFASSPSLSIFW